MTTPISQVPEILSEKLTVNAFLQQSYDQAKKQLGEGVNLIQEGVTFIKEEFSAFYHETGHYLNKMVLPVNNFLKDLTQIDTELQYEVSKDSTQLICLNGNMVPVEQVLSQPMEENY